MTSKGTTSPEYADGRNRRSGAAGYGERSGMREDSVSRADSHSDAGRTGIAEALRHGFAGVGLTQRT